MTAKLRKCPACASEVPAEASVCAHCRTKLPRVDGDWWEASDGLLYSPWQHPDFGKRPPAPRQPMAPRTKRNMIVGFAVAIGLFAAAVVGWRNDVLGVKCDYYRRQLAEAKMDRTVQADGETNVAKAARNARANGCDVDDLIAPSVGR